MLFAIDPEHTPENCPGGPFRPVKNFENKLTSAAKGSGIKLHGIYVDMPGHQICAFAEAETLDQLTGFVSPSLPDVGTTHIHPAVKW